MIRAWLDLSPVGIFAVLIVLYFGITLLLAVVTFCRPFAGPVQSLTGVVAPFFSGIAILFALLTGFLANDVAERGRQAYRVVHTEAGELRNIHTLSVASASDMRTIRAALKTYVTSVVADEWPAMDLLRLSPRTETAYDDLLREVSVPSIAKDSGQAVHSALLTATLTFEWTRTLLPAGMQVRPRSFAPLSARRPEALVPTLSGRFRSAIPVNSRSLRMLKPRPTAERLPRPCWTGQLFRSAAPTTSRLD